MFSPVGLLLPGAWLKTRGGSKIAVGTVEGFKIGKDEILKSVRLGGWGIGQDDKDKVNVYF